MKPRLLVLLTSSLGLWLPSAAPAAPAARCRVVGPRWELECADSSGKPARGHLDYFTVPFVRARTASLGASAALDCGMIDHCGDDEAPAEAFDAKVRFVGAGAALKVLGGEPVYYGASTASADPRSLGRPRAITKAEFIGRYVEAGLDARNAEILVSGALPGLMKLPAGDVRRPGTVYGGQYLFAREFTTSDPVVLVEEITGRVLAALNGSSPLPGVATIDAKAVRPELEGTRFRVARAYASLYALPPGGTEWRMIESQDERASVIHENGRPRYLAQLERAEDRDPENVTPVADRASYRYYEGEIGDWMYFVVLDRATGRIVKTQRIYSAAARR